MMSRCLSAATHGVEGYVVEVEVDIARGLPVLTIVGLPDAAVRESKERIRAALHNAGFDFPLQRITVNLAPARVRKAGTVFELAIAVGILLASGQLPRGPVLASKRIVFLGELSLDGAVSPVSGVLPMVMAAGDAGADVVVLPAGNRWEGELAAPGRVVGMGSLRDVERFLELGRMPAAAAEGPSKEWNNAESGVAQASAGRLEEIRGHVVPKRALEIAAAGGHNLLFVGPPGSGKTTLARAMAGILPPLTREEELEVLRIASVGGSLVEMDGRGKLKAERPFRAPHHTISLAGLIGGGSPPRPGEVTFSHRGVLFLDELPEFRRQALEALRQPLEDGYVTLVRSGAKVAYPAVLTLIASMNPCNCGFLGDGLRKCSCSLQEVMRYHHRISGPLLDRLDMFCSVRRVDPSEILPDREPEPGPTTEEVRRRVLAARERQLERLQAAGITRVTCNGHLTGPEVRRVCRVAEEGTAILERAMSEGLLSARSAFKVIKVAQTICDLDGCRDSISSRQILEALQLRRETALEAA